METLQTPENSNLSAPSPSPTHPVTPTVSVKLATATQNSRTPERNANTWKRRRSHEEQRDGDGVDEGSSVLGSQLWNVWGPRVYSVVFAGLHGAMSTIMMSCTSQQFSSALDEVAAHLIVPPVSSSYEDRNEKDVNSIRRDFDSLLRRFREMYDHHIGSSSHARVSRTLVSRFQVILFSEGFSSEPFELRANQRMKHQERAARAGCYSYHLRRNKVSSLTDNSKRGRVVQVPIPHPDANINTTFLCVEPHKRKSLTDDSNIFSHPLLAMFHGGDDLNVAHEVSYLSLLELWEYLNRVGTLKSLPTHLHKTLYVALKRDEEEFDKIFAVMGKKMGTVECSVHLKRVVSVVERAIEVEESMRKPLRNSLTHLQAQCDRSHWRDEALESSRHLEGLFSFSQRLTRYELREVYRGLEVVLPNLLLQYDDSHRRHLGIVANMRRLLGKYPEVMTCLEKVVLPVFYGERLADSVSSELNDAAFDTLQSFCAFVEDVVPPFLPIHDSSSVEEDGDANPQLYSSSLALSGRNESNWYFLSGRFMLLVEAVLIVVEKLTLIYQYDKFCSESSRGLFLETLLEELGDRWMKEATLAAWLLHHPIAGKDSASARLVSLPCALDLLCQRAQDFLDDDFSRILLGIQIQKERMPVSVAGDAFSHSCVASIASLYQKHVMSKRNGQIQADVFTLCVPAIGSAVWNSDQPPYFTVQAFSPASDADR